MTAPGRAPTHLRGELRTTSRLDRSTLPAIARRLHHGRDLEETFNFLT